MLLPCTSNLAEKIYQRKIWHNKKKKRQFNIYILKQMKLAQYEKLYFVEYKKF